MTTSCGNETIRQLETSSIRAFVERNRPYLKGRVLDFGSGKQPYKDLISGEYVPVEKGDGLVLGDFDAVLCTQVIQEFLDPLELLQFFYAALRSRGILVLTGPTCLAEAKEVNKQGLTQSGIRQLLPKAGFTLISVESLAHLDFEGSSRFSLGYGAIAERR